MYLEEKMPHQNSSSDDEDTANSVRILLDHPDDEYIEIRLHPTENVPAQPIITATQVMAFLMVVALIVETQNSFFFSSEFSD